MISEASACFARRLACDSSSIMGDTMRMHTFRIDQGLTELEMEAFARDLFNDADARPPPGMRAWRWRRY